LEEPEDADVLFILRPCEKSKAGLVLVGATVAARIAVKDGGDAKGEERRRGGGAVGGEDVRAVLPGGTRGGVGSEVRLS
jgi:hypothetical protein